MSRYIQAIVKEIIFEDASVQKGFARIKAGRSQVGRPEDGGSVESLRKFLNYPPISGKLAVGDKIILNTLANDLTLGTGSYDFVVVSLSAPEKKDTGKGHIVKLRYTPEQLQFKSIEEEPRYKKFFDGSYGLEGMPVIVCGVLSQVSAAGAAVRYARLKTKIAFIMTDGGALPLAFSDLIRELKQKKLIHKTITCGQAFGGDHEAVNIYSALLAAKYVAKCDVAIVSIGPGIVGTGTFLGHTGIQQGASLNAAAGLGGCAIMVPRVSFSDKRGRHQGLSHHSQSVIAVGLAEKNVVLPIAGLKKDLAAQLIKQMKTIKARHAPKIVQMNGAPVLEALKKFGLQPDTMGRKLEDDKEFFMMAGASGLYAAELLDK